MPSLPVVIEVSILSTSLRWLITYNVLIRDAEEAEEFLEAAEAEDEFLEAAEAFAVWILYFIN